MASPLKLEGRPALVIIECQRGIIEPSLSLLPDLAQQAQDRGIVANIATLAAAFRSRQLPVFHAPVAHREDFADVKANSLLMALARKSRANIIGTPAADYVQGLEPQPGDFVMDRTGGIIAFLCTALDATLRRLDVSTVVLTGVSTNVAMPGNAMAAVDFGYHVVVPEDCIAAGDPDTHRVLIAQQLRMVARISSTADVIAALPGEAA